MNETNAECYRLGGLLARKYQANVHLLVLRTWTILLFLLKFVILVVL